MKKLSRISNIEKSTASNTSQSAQPFFAPAINGIHRKETNNDTVSIQRQADPQNQVVTVDMPPIMVVSPSAPGRTAERRATRVQAEQQQQVNAIYYGLSDSFQSFVDLWLTVANTALHQATIPDDPTVRSNFYRALGGNMLWAATSFFAEWNPIVIGMSFAGAAIGSGVAAADPYPTGIAEVATLLTQTRDRLYRESIHVRQDVAIDCLQSNITGLENQRMALWRHIYPAVPFNSSDTLRANTLVRINSGLQQFRSQYEAWLNSTSAQGHHRAFEYCNNTFGGGDLGERSARAGCNVSFGSIYTDEARRQHPFSPQLTF